jgi:gliding motility-associated lipoprotein GldD
VLFITSCDQTYAPRPKGYFRIALPEKKYITYNPAECPFSFEIPQYCTVTNYHDSLSQPCWKYINFPQFDAQIFLSYREVNNDVIQFIEDSRSMAYKHSVRASAIDETLITTVNNVNAVVYDIGGSAASSIQFFATDSSSNFLRGALYFNVAPQPDSLAPVIEFIRADVLRIIDTIHWKKKS